MLNKSPLNESFSKAMAYYRALSGKSLKEIAEELDLPPTTVSAWNTGRHLPDMDRLQRLASCLNAPIAHFFDFSMENLPPKDLVELHNRLDTEEELVQFLKIFLQLSDEDKHLLTMLAIKLNK